MTRKGKHIGIRISIRDITEFRQCQALSRSYERLSLAIADELKEVGIFSLTPDRVVKSWNSGAARILGWQKNEIIGSTVDGLLAGDAAIHFAAAETMDRGIEHRAETTFRTKDDAARSVSVMLLNLCNDEGQLHQITCLFRADD
jgi:PAS domain-containing protein